MNDVRKMIYGTLIGFLGVVVFWISIVYISACGFTLTCIQAAHIVERTPIPTLIPAGHSDALIESGSFEFNKCEVAANDLVGAWVFAGSSEDDSFPFADVNGQPCEGTFAKDIQPLFVENSLWYAGAIGCVSCHNSALTERSAGLDLTTVDAMLLGSGRDDAGVNGSDIFGGGNWERSTLYKVLVTQGFAPAGHSAENSPNELIVFAGEVVDEPVATPTP